MAEYDMTLSFVFIGTGYLAFTTADQCIRERGGIADRPEKPSSGFEAVREICKHRICSCRNQIHFQIWKESGCSLNRMRKQVL